MFEFDENDPIYDEDVRARHLREIRHRRAEQRRRDRQQAIAFLVIFVLVITGSIVYFVKSGSDDSDKATKVQQSVTDSVKKDESTTKSKAEKVQHKTEVIDGVTYIDGIMIVNKTYGLPESFDPGLDPEAEQAFNEMAQAANNDGLFIYILSGYRNYADQEYQYGIFEDARGQEEADTVSARPGHSEHQTGLAIDVNSTEFEFKDTAEGKWLADNCVEYGFIIRFPEGKEKSTGFEYEPWHIRYLGVETAKKVADSGLSLEEYLGVDSEYKD